MKTSNLVSIMVNHPNPGLVFVSNDEIERALKFLNEEHFLTRKDLARRYDVNPWTIDIWRRKGLLPKPLYITKKPRWSLIAILAWEANHAKK